MPAWYALMVSGCVNSSLDIVASPCWWRHDYVHRCRKIMLHEFYSTSCWTEGIVIDATYGLDGNGIVLRPQAEALIDVLCQWIYPVSVDSLWLSSPALRWATAGGRKVFSLSDR